MNSGREIRMQKIFSSADDRALCIACDHGLMMDPSQSWLKIAEVVDSAVHTRVDGLLLSSGQAVRFTTKYGRGVLPASIVRTDWTNFLRLNGNPPTGGSLLPIDQVEYRRLLTAQDVLYRYAGSAAIGFLFMDPDRKMESLTVKACAELVKECHAIGLPGIIEVLSLIVGHKDSNPEDLLWRGVWLALEMGADAIKMPMSADMPQLCSAIHQAGKRLFALGGSNLSDETLFLSLMQQAMDVGVDGLLVGRNVSKSPDPGALIHKLRSIVHPEPALGQIDD